MPFTTDKQRFQVKNCRYLLHFREINDPSGQVMPYSMTIIASFISFYMTAKTVNSIKAYRMWK